MKMNWKYSKSVYSSLLSCLPRSGAALVNRVVLALCILSGIIASPVAAQEFSDRSSVHISGLANDSNTKATELGDFNGDGIDDIVISRRNANPVLLINEGGVLANRTGEFLPNSAAASNSNYAEAFDANNDGLIDIVFARLSNRTPYLYLNTGNDSNGQWQGFDSGRAIAGATNGLVIESGDVTGDGAADLFVIQVVGFNVLLVNDGNGNFAADNSRLGALSRDTDFSRGHQVLLDDVDKGTHEIGSQMPFRGRPLDTATVDAIQLWINSGAQR